MGDGTDRLERASDRSGSGERRVVSLKKLNKLVKVFLCFTLSHQSHIFLGARPG